MAELRINGCVVVITRQNSDPRTNGISQNTCYLYPSVLFVEALVDLLSLLEQDKLLGIFDRGLLSRIAIALFQACLRPLLDQQADGSWNQSIEETAYGILILTEARRVCFFDDLHQPLDGAIERALAFVNSISDHSLDCIWIEKVSYASPLLTESYLLAAPKAAAPHLELRLDPASGTTRLRRAWISTSSWTSTSSCFIKHSSSVSDRGHALPAPTTSA